jgi:hypothetical protein
VPDQQQEDDDRQRYAEQPQQYAFSHVCLLSMTVALTVRRRNVFARAEFRGWLVCAGFDPILANEISLVSNAAVTIA